MNSAEKISERTIERMSQYRKILDRFTTDNVQYIYSHELAKLCGHTAAQVRRDLMTIGFSGGSSKGYDVVLLNRSIDEFMGFSVEKKIVLVGIGHLGRALLNFFSKRNPMLNLVAAFDINPDKSGRVIHDVQCYSIDEMESIIRDQQVEMAIITVPADAAQESSDRLVACGIKGLLNFAPVQLKVPLSVYVENLDLTSVLEKVAYFAVRR
jgi:redox-sensing transcriptional repressor